MGNWENNGRKSNHFKIPTATSKRSVSVGYEDESVNTHPFPIIGITRLKENDR